MATTPILGIKQIFASWSIIKGNTWYGKAYKYFKRRPCLVLIVLRPG